MTDAVDVAALRAGDELAFRALVNDIHSTLIRLAMMYSPNRAVAEETVQETWIAVLGGLDGYAGRASLRTWITRILVRIAQRRAGQEARVTPFDPVEDQSGFVSVAADRFVASGPLVGRWISRPNDFAGVPEDEVLSGELQDVVRCAIEALPKPQQEVITLRDVEGWSSAEVSELLEITDGNQRVLLHRARTKVRAAVDAYLGGSPGEPSRAA